MSSTKERLARLDEYREKLAKAEQRLREFQSDEQVEARDARRAWWFGQWMMLEGRINQVALEWVRPESSKLKEDWLFEDLLLKEDSFEVTSYGRRKKAE